MDPFLKLSNSNTPYGPFQIIVCAFYTACLFNLIVSSPQSKPNHPSLIPSLN